MLFLPRRRKFLFFLPSFLAFFFRCDVSLTPNPLRPPKRAADKREREKAGRRKKREKYANCIKMFVPSNDVFCSVALFNALRAERPTATALKGTEEDKKFFMPPESLWKSSRHFMLNFALCLRESFFKSLLCEKKKADLAVVVFETRSDFAFALLLLRTYFIVCCQQSIISTGVQSEFAS